MTGIEPIHQIQYDHGHDPIEWAVFIVATDLKIREEVAAGDIKHGVPITLLDQSDQAYARRIVAKLLDAGWTAPQTGGRP
jgi:putative aminopeptidase FrvX